jgi:hypothetical protein
LTIFAPDLTPIAVPVDGKATPKDDDVPPDAPPALMLTRRLPALSSWRGLAFPLVIVVGAVLNWPPIRRELAGLAAF